MTSTQTPASHVTAKKKRRRKATEESTVAWREKEPKNNTHCQHITIVTNTSTVPVYGRNQVESTPCWVPERKSGCWVLFWWSGTWTLTLPTWCQSVQLHKCRSWLHTQLPHCSCTCRLHVGRVWWSNHTNLLFQSRALDCWVHNASHILVSKGFHISISSSKILKNYSGLRGRFQKSCSTRHFQPIKPSQCTSSRNKNGQNTAELSWMCLLVWPRHARTCTSNRSRMGPPQTPRRCQRPLFVWRQRKGR